METIKEAKAFLRENFDAGTPVDCPCCGQMVKQYKRPMHSTMARTLIELYKLGQGYHHYKEFNGWNPSTGMGDFAKFEFWGLVEQRGNTDEGKRTSGDWRITSTGIQFVLEEITVPSHVLLFDNKFLGFAGDEVGIQDVIKNKFDYSEVMGYAT